MATAADLPNEFDIIVVGTGLTETILAAAFSRIGLKVLHLDRNDYYGGAYANFNLQAIETWKEKNDRLAENTTAPPESAEATDIQNLLSDGEKAIALPLEPAHAFNIKTQFHIRERTAEEEAAAEDKRTKPRFHTPPVKLPLDSEPKQTERQPEFHEKSENADKSDSENKVEKPAPEDKLEKATADNGQAGDHGPGEIGAGDGTVGPASSEDGTVGPASSQNGTVGPASSEDGTVGSASSEDGTVRPASSEDGTVGPASSEDGTVVGESCGDSNGKPVEEGKLVSDDSGVALTSESGAKAVTDGAEQSDGQQSREWTIGDIKDEWRKFCFDISPKVLYSSGDTVELLIQSDVSRYCEFRTVSRVLTLLNDRLQQVPCSRADVFSSKTVSLIEKRLMMKFLQFAADYESNPGEYQDFSEKPFVEFLKSKRLTPNIHNYVQHAIAMVTDTATTVEGLKSTQMFLRSLGRYGNTAFLFPLYGTGELPQAFARLSAVFGGVYCLQMSPTHIVADGDNNCCGIIASNGQLIRCKYLIAETSYLPPSFVWALSSRRTSRAIYITDSSILSSVEAELSLLNLTCNDDPSRPVTVLELPPSACVCPQNLFVVHLTRTAATNSNPEEEFSEVKEKLFTTDIADGKGAKPMILWSAYFTQEDRSQMVLSDVAVKNVLVVSGGGDASVGLDFCVDEAKCIYQTVCPDEDFLPKPPNPEDIIHIDDTEAAVATGPSEYESVDNQEEVGDKERDMENRVAPEADEGIAVVQRLVDEINIETGEDWVSRDRTS